MGKTRFLKSVRKNNRKQRSAKIIYSANRTNKTAKVWQRVVFDNKIDVAHEAYMILDIRAKKQEQQCCLAESKEYEMSVVQRTEYDGAQVLVVDHSCSACSFVRKQSILRQFLSISFGIKFVLLFTKGGSYFS